MGKNILLIAATAKEISPAIQLLRTESGKISFAGIDILISGIGLTASAYHLLNQIRLKNYDLVIQAGVAGCFDLTMPLNSVVVVKQDTIADQSVIELKKLKTLFDLKLVPEDQPPFNKGWLINPGKELLKLSGLKQVKSVSVNQISTSKKIIDFYRNSFNPVTESMEGAALHYVCLQEKIPFVQFRSISNYIGERNKKKWTMNESITILNKELVSFLKKL